MSKDEEDGKIESTDPDLLDKMSKVVEENEDGLRSLADEEPAAKKRSENSFKRFIRFLKRKLGLRESDASVIQV